MTSASSEKTGYENHVPDRNLAMELVRVTEAAAIAASPWVGYGDKNKADGAAVDAMRAFMDTVAMDGTVVIGEGEKDEAPMLFNGEQVGDGSGAAVDVAVDPIDGTRLTALGMNNALAVIAVADGGSMFDPSAVFYMDKLVVGPEAADFVDMRLPVKQNVNLVAKALDKPVSQVTVCVLDRPVTRAWSRRSARPAPAAASSPTATWPPPPARTSQPSAPARPSPGSAG